jgi:hypothetical protein
MMYSLLLPAFTAARIFTESLLSNDDIPLLLHVWTCLQSCSLAMVWSDPLHNYIAIWPLGLVSDIFFSLFPTLISRGNTLWLFVVWVAYSDVFCCILLPWMNLFLLRAILRCWKYLNYTGRNWKMQANFGTSSTYQNKKNVHNNMCREHI